MGSPTLKLWRTERGGRSPKELTRPVVYAIVKSQDEHSWDSPRDF